MKLVTFPPQNLLCERKGHAAVITFNRPEALNALSLDMIVSFQKALDDYARDPSVKLVIVKGKGNKAFCAGGDVRSVFEARKEHNYDLMESLFRHEYTNNYHISQFPKPYVAFMNGVTMGGGMGMSVYASHRIVSETSILAMPEALIGFYPDVGASYFFNQIPGEIGTYLAITGNKFNASDALYTGIATHYIPMMDQRDLEEQLYCCQSIGEIDAALSYYQDPMYYPSILMDYESTVNDTFCHDTMEGIVAALSRHHNEFAQMTLKRLGQVSPTSQKLTLEMQRWGEGKSLKECLSQEFSVTMAIIQRHEFFEGIRAQLIDKDYNPKWSPPTLEQVDDTLIADIMTKCQDKVLDLSPPYLENVLSKKI